MKMWKGRLSLESLALPLHGTFLMECFIRMLQGYRVNVKKDTREMLKRIPRVKFKVLNQPTIQMTLVVVSMFNVH